MTGRPRYAMTVAAVTVIASVAACTGRRVSPIPGAPGATSRATARAPRDRTLGPEDLARVDRTQSLYDAIVALRPQFLTFRGTQPTVYVNGVLAGPVSVLRDIPVAWVERVRMLSPDEATLLYGTSRGGAAIQVTRRGVTPR
jgi:hypothetical protein